MLLIKSWLEFSFIQTKRKQKVLCRNIEGELLTDVTLSSAFAQLVLHICINEKCDEFKCNVLSYRYFLIDVTTNIVLQRLQFMWQTFAGDSCSVEYIYL